MATYDFDRVLVWEAAGSGSLSILKGGTVSVLDWATDAVIDTATSDTSGHVAFTTTDVAVVVLRSPSGFRSEPIVAPAVLTAAALLAVSEDAAVAALVADNASETRAALGDYVGTQLDPVVTAQGDLTDRVDALEADTGWVDLTVNAGFAAISVDEKPQVRLRGDIVYMRGGWSNTGMSANANNGVGSLPAGGFAPAQTVSIAAGASNGNATAQVFILNDGTVQVRTGGTLGSYYKATTVWVQS